VALTPEQRSDLVAYLSEWCTFGELRDVAYDLGAGFEVYSRQTKEAFSLALIHSLERAGRVGRLVDRAQRMATGETFPLSPVPSLPDAAHRVVVLHLPEDWEDLSLPTLRRDLAVAFGVPEDEVVWMGAAGKEVRLLVSLPDTQRALPDLEALSSRYDGGTLRAYRRLRRSARKTWRAVTVRHPPERHGVRLKPAVDWASARKKDGARGEWILPVTMVLLGTAILAVYHRYGAQIPAALAEVQAFGARVVGQAVPWIEFLGSVSLSVLALSWLTALLFVGSALSLYLLPRIVYRLSTRYPARSWLPSVGDAIDAFTGRYRRVVGTVLVLGSSACALLVFSHLFRRPLDYWDYGIQAALALLLELIVLGVALRISDFYP
jgi:hypothetical protein